jgi:hypothetical protein
MLHELMPRLSVLCAFIMEHSCWNSFAAFVVSTIVQRPVSRLLFNNAICHACLLSTYLSLDNSKNCLTIFHTFLVYEPDNATVSKIDAFCGISSKTSSAMCFSSQTLVLLILWLVMAVCFFRRRRTSDVNITA